MGQIVLPRRGNALAAIAEALSQGPSVDALHILSHGRSGALRLCDATVDLDALETQRPDIARIQARLSPRAEIVIYGCSVARGRRGADFIDRLEILFGCPVRAGNGPVGGSALGGTWPEPGSVALAFDEAVRLTYPALLSEDVLPDASVFRVYSTLTPYEEGTISLRVKPSDLSWSSTSDQDFGRLSLPALMVDTIPPRTLAPPDLVASSDLGVSSSDNVTSSPTQEFSGSAVSGDIVSILVGGVTANTVTVVDGSWTYTHTLTAGSYAITVHATDAAGNVGARSSALGLIIDTSVPGVAGQPALFTNYDSGASHTDGVTNEALPRIFGGGGVPTGLIYIIVDGTTTGSALADSSGNWAYTFETPLADGAHVITAVASDAAGNNAEPSVGLSVVIDTTAPTLHRPDLIAASDTGISSADNITSSRTQQFGGSASDGDAIRILVNGLTTRTITASGGSWSYTHTLGPGTYDIAVQGKDLAGNVGVVSPALSLTVDTTVPGALDAPDLSAASDTGISSTDGITSAAIQQLTGSAVNGDIVSILVDGVTANTVTASGGSWTYAHTLGEGTFQVSVQATDPAGNAGPVSPTLSLTVDTTGPTSTPDQPDLLADSDTGISTTDNVTAAIRPAIAGIGASPDGLVRVFVGGEEAGSVPASSTGAWSFTFSEALSDGTHAVTIVSEDVAGNSSPQSVALTLQIDTAAAAANRPDLASDSDTGLSSLDDITTVANPTLQGDGAEVGARIHVLADGITVGNVTASDTGAWSYTFTSSLSEGGNAISVVQTDTAGNISLSSPVLNVVLDTTAPTALGVPGLLAVSDLGASSTDSITSSTTQSLTGSAADGDRVHILVDGVTARTVIAAGGSWSYGHTLAEGSYAVSVGVTDAAGNAGPVSGTLHLVVDTTAPEPPAQPDLAASSDMGVSSVDNLTNIATPTLQGSGATAQAHVHILVDGVTAGTTVAGGTGAWSFTFSEALAAGSRAISVVAEDVAGNEAAASQALIVEMDLSAPAAPGVFATPDLVSASDDGSSIMDNVTTVATPTFSGTHASASAVHALLANGVTVGGFVSQSDGTYQVVTSSLAPGTYDITIRELDAAGNVSADSQALALTIAAPPGSGGGGGGGSGGGGVVVPPPTTPTPTPVPATTSTTTTTTTTSAGLTVTTQIQTIENRSTTGTASAEIVQSAGAGGNGVTAILPAQTSITAEGPSSPQSPEDALATLISSAEARQGGGGAELQSGMQSFINRLGAAATLDVRTIVPTTTATSLATPIVITGASSDVGNEAEAFVIDVRSLPSGSTVQIDNIEFASIIGSATVNGGSGNNFAIGDNASQFISLGEGDDTLLGGDGDDTIGSGTGDDSLDGEEGNDRVFGGDGQDTVIGGAGIDVIYGNQQSDVLYGNWDNDILFGGQEADTLFGGRDDDVLYGNLAADSLSGQLGNDTLFGGQGDDLIRGGVGDDRLLGNRDSDTLSGGSGDDTLSGGAEVDLLSGGAGDDRLNGGDGDDTLYGGSAGGALGIDVLEGGAGNDVLMGGAGVDWIYTGSGRDSVYVEASNGFDVIVDFDLAAGDVVHVARNVNGSGLVSFAGLLEVASDNVDGEAEIDLGSNNYIRMMGMTTAQLTSDMFQFF